MRPIKYRVWDKRTNQMRLVASISLGEAGLSLTIMAEPAPKGKYYDAIVHGESGILIQFTGEVDENGTEIYEGDIVEVYRFGEHCRRVVKWGWISDDYATCYGFIFDGNSRYVKVIGNQYENPELIPHE